MKTQTKIKLTRGQFLEIQGTVYRADNQTSGGDWSLRNPATGEPRQISQAQLLDLYMRGQAKLKVQDPAKTSKFERQCLEFDFASVLEDHQAFARRTKVLLDAIIKAGCPSPRRKFWPVIIEEAAKKENVEPRSWGQLAKWMKKYLAADCDIRALLPGYRRRGAGRLAMSEQEREFFFEQVALYLTEERPTLHEVHGWLVDAYAKARLEIAGAASWKTPSFSTLHRRLKEADPYYLMAARYDKDAADLYFRSIGPGHRALHALELVEIDHTVGDVMLVCDKHGYVLGRPTITIAMDKYSGMVVGLYVGFEPAGVAALMHCLHNMILPKTYMTEHFPELARAGVEWPAWGIPIQIMADNGMEFHSQSFKDVSAVLGMDIKFQPVGEPWAKGMIERFMGSLAKSGLNWMPGKTFSNPMERGDYDSEGRACITLNEFRMLLHAYIILRHNTKMNSKTFRVPEVLWMREMETNPPRLPVSVADIDNLLGTLNRKTLTREGLEFKGLHYNSPQLNQVLRDASFQSMKDKTVAFKMNENDLGEIAVIHPVTSAVFKVPCTDQEISAGISKYQHELYRETLRRQGQDYQKRENLILARRWWGEYAQNLLSKKSAKNRKSVARALGDMFTNQPKGSSAPLIEILPKAPAQAMARLHEENELRHRDVDKPFRPFFVSDPMQTSRSSDSDATSQEYDPDDDDDIQPFHSRKPDGDGGKGERE